MENFYKKNFFYNFIFSIIFVLIIISIYIDQPLTYMNLFFESLKNKTFYISIDQNIKDFIHHNNVNLITNIISIVYEVIFFLIGCLIIYYGLYFVIIIFMRKIKKFKIQYIIKKYIFSVKSNKKKEEIFKYIINLFTYNSPFIMAAIFYGESFWVFVFIVFIILHFFHKKINKRVSVIILLFNSLLTLILCLLLFYYFGEFDFNGFMPFIEVYYNIYIIISISMLLLFALFYLIQIEFRIASVEKKYIFLKKLFEVNIKSDFSSYKQEIIEHINIRKSISKTLRADQRGKILYNRNLQNLFVSSYISMIFLLSIIIAFYFFEDYANKIIVVSLIFILLRSLMRSYEIIKAFFMDAISDDPKKSNLNYLDRIKLILKSLLEITVLFSFLKISYYLLINEFETTSFSLRNLFNLIFESYSASFFNVSYTFENGLVFGFIHVIQISISACLILLSFALYSGKNNNNINFEVIINKFGKYEVYENLLLTNNKKETISKYRFSFSTEEHLKQLWENSLISNEEFELISQELTNLKNWIAENEKIGEWFLSLHKDYERLYKSGKNL